MIGANLVISFVYLTYERQDQLSYYRVTNGYNCLPEKSKLEFYYTR